MTTMMPSPLRRTKSPDISVTAYDKPVTCSSSSYKSADEIDQSALVPPSLVKQDASDNSDRYFTASSGDDCYDDDDDDGMCIRLDSDDDDDQSLSGFHINLKTLQEVSSMLARYNPIIQSDLYGNPMFNAPPPPPEDEYFEEKDTEDEPSSVLFSVGKRPVPTPRNQSTASHDSTLTADDDYQNALQELDEALVDQDRNLFSDAMTELTDVMEKMTNFVADTANDDVR